MSRAGKEYHCSVSILKDALGGWLVHWYDHLGGEEDYRAASSLRRARGYLRRQYGRIIWEETGTHFWAGYVAASLIEPAEPCED